VPIRSEGAYRRILSEMATLIATFEGVERNADHVLLAVALSQELGLEE
jgi:hypothetical protein